MKCLHQVCWLALHLCIDPSWRIDCSRAASLLLHCCFTAALPDGKHRRNAKDRKQEDEEENLEWLAVSNPTSHLALLCLPSQLLPFLKGCLLCVHLSLFSSGLASTPSSAACLRFQGAFGVVVCAVGRSNADHIPDHRRSFCHEPHLCRHCHPDLWWIHRFHGLCSRRAFPVSSHATAINNTLSHSVPCPPPLSPLRCVL